MREQIETHTEARHQEFKENSKSIVIEVAAVTSGDKERTESQAPSSSSSSDRTTVLVCCSSLLCYTFLSQTLIDNREVKWRII